MTTSTPPDYEIVFQKLDEAMQEQCSMAGVALSQTVQDCEEIRFLREMFEEQLDSPALTFTRA